MTIRATSSSPRHCNTSERLLPEVLVVAAEVVAAAVVMWRWRLEEGGEEEEEAARTPVEYCDTIHDTGNTTWWWRKHVEEENISTATQHKLLQHQLLQNRLVPYFPPFLTPLVSFFSPWGCQRLGRGWGEAGAPGGRVNVR